MVHCNSILAIFFISSVSAKDPIYYINTVPCDVADIVKVDEKCIPWYPHFDREGQVCANDGAMNEAYCSYDVGEYACAYCKSAKSCYFDCKSLTLDHGGTQLGQVGNCGYDCTSGIASDINGVVHPELFLWKQGYWENGKWYNYGAGPLNVHDSDNNMFDRCYNECFVAVDDYIGNDGYIKKDQTSKNFGIMELTR